MKLRSILRYLRFAFLGLAALVASATALGVCLYLFIDFDPKKFEFRDNTVFTDREGKVLRFLPDERGERRLWVPLEKIPLVLQQAFLAAEDERFYRHWGFDPLAIIRAIGSNVSEGKIVSGASTLTQQVVRSVYPRRRTYSSKVTEAIRAFKAEGCLTKDEILEAYLNRAPLGNNLVGIKVAAQTYFGKSLEDLSLSECALLAALPKAPGSLNPYRRPQNRLLSRRNWVLRRMRDLGSISEAEYSSSIQHPIRVIPKSFPMEAPHFVDLLLARGAANGISPPVQTTIDLDLQRRLEKIVVSHRERLKNLGGRQAAALIVDNRNLEVLAMVGSFRYGPQEGGYNNGCVALRSPGSTLKPFLYALALERGYTPASLLEDTERRYRSSQGEYLPHNYSRNEYGPIKVREALGNSLNLSAIRMITEIGYRPFFEWLKQADLINNASKDADDYGLGIAIGNPEVTLEQLVTAYAMLAHGGTYRPLRYSLSDPRGDEVPLLSAQSSWLITNILSDPSAHALTFGSAAHLDFPYRVAWKTGTSNGYRDSWICGYTPEYTVGVWAGNFQGDATYHLSGSEGAGGIVADVIKELYQGSNPGTFEQPPGIVQAEVCSHSGMAPCAACPSRMQEWFIAGTVPTKQCTFHQHDQILHEIPTQYAGWVHDQAMKGIDSPYVLPETTKASSSLPALPEAVTDRQTLDSAQKQRVLIGSDPTKRFVQPDFQKNELQILYPLDDDRFLLGSTEGDARVRLEAEVRQPETQITWFIDGVEFEKSGPPYRTYWSPEKGTHTLSAVGSNGIADSVRVVVE